MTLESLREAEELKDRVLNLEHELKMSLDIIQEFKENIYNMVMANPKHYQRNEIDVWEMFVNMVLTEEQRRKYGWLTAEDLNH